MVGRELYPLLNNAGYRSVRVSPEWSTLTPVNLNWSKGSRRKTFTAMIEVSVNRQFNAE